MTEQQRKTESLVYGLKVEIAYLSFARSLKWTLKDPKVLASLDRLELRQQAFLRAQSDQGK